MSTALSRKSSANRSAGFDVRVPGIDYGVLDELTGYAIRRAQLVITEAFDTSFSGVDLTTQRFSALVLIGENPGLKQTELAQVMGIARSGALAIVTALIRDGLVVQQTADTDRRACALYLTPAGKRRLPRIIRRVRKHDDAVTDGLSTQERAELVRLLSKVQSLR